MSCLSLLQDLSAGLYKNKKTGAYISFGNSRFPITDEQFRGRLLRGEIQCNDFKLTEEIIDRFSKEWEFAGITPIDLLFRNLDYIYDNVKGNPIIILMLGSEIDYSGKEEEFAGSAETNRQINPVITEFAEDHDRMRVINATDFVNSQDDYRDSENHLTRNVYYKIAGRVCDYINEAVSRKKL